MWVATTPPPGGAALAVHDQVVAFDLDLDAVGAQHGGGGCEPVGFLDAQFLQAAHPRRAFGEGGRDREDRIFVDHGRRALGRHVDALQRAGLDPQIGDVLAALVALLERFDRRRPSPQRREQAGAQRIESSRLRARSRSPARSAPRPAGTPPTTDRPAPRPAPASSSGWPCSVMRRPCSPIVARRATLAPKCLSIFSVWSRVASFSITVVAPGAARPASSTADLSCADGTGASYSIGIGSRAPCTSDRQPAALAHLRGARAHLLQRIEDAPHRPRAQAGVAVERRRDRAAGHRAHGQPAAGAGIAEIERRGRLGEAADADARARARPARRCARRRRPAPSWRWRC